MTQACRHADQCNEEGRCTNGCEERKRKMNEIEIAAGATMAAHSAAHIAWKRASDDSLHLVEGSRARTCANANTPKLREAMELLEKASRLFDDARARQVRMTDA